MAKKKASKQEKKKKRKAKKQKAKQKAKQQYRTRNWAEYDKSLVQRGSLTLWVNEDVIKAWKPDGPKKKGGQYEYSDLAIECLLTLRCVHHLSLRATQGFAQSLFGMMGLELPVPNYSTLSRRSKKLGVSLPRQAQGALHIVVDSTGLKIYGEGEWKVRQHGYSKRRTWRKLHLAVDAVSGEIQAVLLSASSMDDAAAVPDLLDEITNPIKEIDADGAYDKRKVYEACKRREVERVLIPPRKDAQLWPEEDEADAPHPRNQNLRAIEELGRKEWKRQSGYHQRSLAETAVFRFKTIFGNTLQARGLAKQVTEARIKAAALNRMTQLGMPDSYPVAAYAAVLTLVPVKNLL
jgi:hypothetical protein